MADIPMVKATRNEAKVFQVAIDSVVDYLVGRAVEARGPSVADQNKAAYFKQLAKEIQREFSIAA